MGKNPVRFVLIVCAIIIGHSIYKHFNYETMDFEKGWLDAVYVVTFIFILVLLIKDYFGRKTKKIV